MRSIFCLAAIGTTAAASPALAQDLGSQYLGQYGLQTVNSGDTAWLLIAALLGLAAVAGSFLLHARQGATALALMIAAAASILWAVAGYSLAFSGAASFIGDFSTILLGGLADIVPGTAVPESAVVLFELVFGLVALAIVSAALAGAAVPRPLAFALLWFALAYLPLCHWVRGGGWLAGLGTLDLAGGLVIHVGAGAAALAIGLIFASSPATPAAGDDQHCQSRAALAFLPGSLALIGGATLAAGDIAAAALLNVWLATAVAALVWAGIERTRHGTTGIDGIASGAIAGLAAISASAGYIGTVGALVTGLVAGLASYGARAALRQRGWDTTTATIVALHGIGGVTGAALLGLLAFPALGGPGFDEQVTPASQIAAQAIGIVAVAIWSGVVTLGLCWLVSLRRRAES